MSRSKHSYKLRIEDRLILTSVKLLQFILRKLPYDTSMSFAKAVGSVLAHCSKRRHIAYQNLRSCFAQTKRRKELKRILVRSYQNLAISMAEFLLMPYMKDDQLNSLVEVKELDRIMRELKDGHGLIFLTGHFGNWELSNIISRLYDVQMAVLVKAQKHPLSDGFLNSIREHRNNRVVYRGMNIRELITLLKRGGVVGILADQDAGKKGIYTKLFGRSASFPKGIARFVKLTNASIIPTFMVRVGESKHQLFPGTRISLDEIKDEQQVDQKIVDNFSAQLEGMVRQYPEQWLWAHRRWKTTKDFFCVVLWDGKKGHLTQSLAFSDAIKSKRQRKGFDASTTHIKQIRVEYKSKFRQKLLSVIGLIFRGHFIFSWNLLRWALSAKCLHELETTYADAVVSCGSSTEAVNLIFSKENRAKPCYIHKPQFGYRHYAALLIPSHDRVSSTKKNIYATIGALNNIDLGLTERFRDQFTTRWEILDTKSTKIGLLIGGISKTFNWNEDLFEYFVNTIKKLEVSLRFDLLVTTSRRTTTQTEAFIQSAFKDWLPCKVCVVANQFNPPGTIQGILALSDILIVTSDSISMLSEAIVTGKRVIVLSEEQVQHRKIKSFLEKFKDNSRVCVTSKVRFEDDLKQFLSQKHNEFGRNPNEEVLSRAAKAVIS